MANIGTKSLVFTCATLVGRFLRVQYPEVEYHPPVQVPETMPDMCYGTLSSILVLELDPLCRIQMRGFQKSWTVGSLCF